MLSCIRVNSLLCLCIDDSFGKRNRLGAVVVTVPWTVTLEMTGLEALHCVICSLVFIRTQWEVEYVCTVYVWTAAKSLQSCLTLCDPIDGSPR